MTAADLSANAKPWEAHQSTVQNVIEEFYAQVSFHFFELTIYRVLLFTNICNKVS